MQTHLQVDKFKHITHIAIRKRNNMPPIDINMIALQSSTKSKTKNNLSSENGSGQYSDVIVYSFTTLP